MQIQLQDAILENKMQKENDSTSSFIVSNGCRSLGVQEYP